MENNTDLALTLSGTVSLLDGVIILTFALIVLFGTLFLIYTAFKYMIKGIVKIETKYNINLGSKIITKILGAIVSLVTIKTVAKTKDEDITNAGKDIANDLKEDLNKVYEDCKNGEKNEN